MNFSELGLGEELLKAIEEIGYTTPTPIQEKAIPIVLMARDLIGLAQTGTGKTASFTLPMIEMLALPDPDDRHVLAAAIVGKAKRIVTFNLTDFPATSLSAYGIEA